MWVGVTLRVAAAITLHLTCHTGPQLAHALRPHPHEGTGCDLGQWRRWGEATPALGVLEALFRILPRRCRPTLARVGLQGGARAHQEQPVDGAQGRSASGCRAWAHRATVRSYHASRNRLIRAVTVTVTFGGVTNGTRLQPPCNAYPRPRPARGGRGTPTARGPEATRVVQGSKHRSDAGFKPSGV